MHSDDEYDQSHDDVSSEPIDDNESDYNGEVPLNKMGNKKRLNKIGSKEVYAEDSDSGSNYSRRGKYDEGVNKAFEGQGSDVEPTKRQPLTQEKEEDINEDEQKILNEMARREAHFDDVKSITLQRGILEQWIEEPFFTKTVIGMFVRINF